jgi:hypothetical protein
MAPWLRVLEAYLVQALLRTPAFHRGVEKVARQVHRVRHGIPPEEMGGTKLDEPGKSGFLKHFTEEVQAQLGRAEARNADAAAKSIGEKGSAGRGSSVPNEQPVMEEANADAVWETARKQTERKVADEGVVGADAAWETARRQTEKGAKRGFIGEYIEALKEQGRNGK